ncbi:hypothetical protein AMTRI_Chr07g80860 [Amborella trichopoda]
MELYFRGQRIWEAIIYDLLQKGLINVKKALLSGCSAGGLATFLHCDDLGKLLPRGAIVKCLSDAGFFLDASDVSGGHYFRSFIQSVVSLHGVEKNLTKNCTSVEDYPGQCFFPQYELPFLETPFFILNSAYDIFQFHNILVPSSADPHGDWNVCKLNPLKCDLHQFYVLQAFRINMIATLRSFNTSKTRGIFINSCFAHCQSESQDTWLGEKSPSVRHKTIANAVGDWYFGREAVWEIDCPYPCDITCRNLIPRTLSIY